MRSAHLSSIFSNSLRPCEFESPSLATICSFSRGLHLPRNRQLSTLPNCSCLILSAIEDFRLPHALRRHRHPRTPGQSGIPHLSTSANETRALTCFIKRASPCLEQNVAGGFADYTVRLLSVCHRVLRSNSALLDALPSANDDLDIPEHVALTSPRISSVSPINHTQFSVPPLPCS